MSAWNERGNAVDLFQQMGGGGRSVVWIAARTSLVAEESHQVVVSSLKLWNYDS